MEDLKNALGWILLVAGCAVGLYFIVLMAYFYWKYIICNGAGCGELLLGSAIVSLFIVSSFIPASIGALFVGKKNSQVCA
jgi:hypothetical protein